MKNILMQWENLLEWSIETLYSYLVIYISYFIHFQKLTINALITSTNVNKGGYYSMVDVQAWDDVLDDGGHEMVAYKLL